MVIPSDRDTVAVIIPMYNAKDTIAETLESVRRQTYANLDIVVVDDGSSDAGSRIVESIAAADRRVRLIQQANAGVAAARNRGAAETNAPYLTFLDADDLWAPDKVAAQMSVVDEGTPALVYCWFCQIDLRGRIYRSNHLPPSHEGDVRHQLARENFIGNGSSMLMHREVFRKVGGFDVSLLVQDAQGCEDYMFAMAAAQHFPFLCVPRKLVGYRLTHGNMSSDAERMVRSYELVVKRFEQQMSEFVTEFHEHHRNTLLWHARRAAAQGELKRTVAMVRWLNQHHGMTSIRTKIELAAFFMKACLMPQWMKYLAARLGLIVRPKYLDLPW